MSVCWMDNLRDSLLYIYEDSLTLREDEKLWLGLSDWDSIARFRCI